MTTDAAAMESITRGSAQAAGRRHRDGVRGNLLFGAAIALALVGGLGGWVATTSLAGAVIAGGTVVVESSVKAVQHQLGGIVGEILVRNGDRVTAGEVVIRLDETTLRANLDIVSNHLDRARIRMARLEAELAGAADMSLPQSMRDRADDPDVRLLLSGERALFLSRSRSLASRITALKSRSEQYRQQIAGLDAQRRAVEDALVVLKRDLATVRDLYERKLVSLERLSSLELQIAQQKGEIGRLTAAIAEAEGRVSENALQVMQIEDEARETANAELREVESREAELIERRQIAADQLARTTIRAPQTGLVQELAVHTVGGVVNPGQTLMLIVPENDALVVDAQISPVRIDEIASGQPVLIRFSAFDRNSTPECRGRVDMVSADLVRDEATHTAFYKARILIEDGPTCLADGQRLLPGMPVEVHINTGERTVWSYIAKPILDQFQRSLRE
ncbi:MAG TPA: HlyD family type I secretion periplasmic adaptor subunit [Rhizobiales bacterium]|nr:HlyD family type I secretion periplasmic adaptor subunit [Hyphomicrobiales bacterium]